MENDPTLAKAQAFQNAFEKANIRLVHKIDDLNAQKQEFEGSDLQDTDLRDPNIIAADVAAQIVRACPFLSSCVDWRVAGLLSETEIPVLGTERKGQIRQIHRQQHR